MNQIKPRNLSTETLTRNDHLVVLESNLKYSNCHLSSCYYFTCSFNALFFQSNCLITCFYLHLIHLSQARCFLQGLNRVHRVFLFIVDETLECKNDIHFMVNFGDSYLFPLCHKRVKLYITVKYYLLMNSAG